MKTIRRILVTGDILRPNDNRPGNQNLNINWFYNLFEFFIKTTTPTVPLQKLLSETNSKAFDVELFYRLNGLEISVNNWAKLFDSSEVSKKAEEYFQDYFQETLVIGYELPKIFVTLMKKFDIDYIEFIIHPIRFVDDIFFGVLSSSESVMDRLKKYCLNVNLPYAIASMHKASISRFKDLSIGANSGLLVGQTEVDRSLIDKGRMVSLLDYRDEIALVKENHDTVYFKPHPYAAKNKDLGDFLRKRDVRFVEENIYYLICQPNIQGIFAISSSVIEEAKYFGIEAKWFMGKNECMHLPVFGGYFNSQFWKDILSCYCDIDNDVNIQIPEKASRLRDNLGWYWGYNIFGSEKIYHDIARRNKEKLGLIHSIAEEFRIINLYRKWQAFRKK